MLAFCFALLLATPTEPVAIPIEKGQTATISGYVMTRSAIARLLAEPAAIKARCNLEKEHIAKLAKLEREKQIEKVVAEYETRLKSAALSTTPETKQAKSDKWLIVGAFGAGLATGIITFLAVWALK